MKSINLETPDFKVKIYLLSGIIEFVCKEIVQEFDMEGCEQRVYDIPKIGVDKFEHDSERGYFYIYFSDKTFYQIKFESSCEIIIDHFTNEGELIDEVGAWNFYDE